MTSRDQILTKLRAKVRPAELPPAWTSQRNFTDLAQRFTQALTAAKGEVIRAASLPDALNLLAELLVELDAKTGVVNGSDITNLTGFGILSGLGGDVDWFIIGQSEGDARAACAQADVGLSSAEAALAETGTLVLSSGPGHSRLATLLPPVHIALLPAARLTADLFTWQQQKPDPFPANLNFISGPSKTADIEQTMAVGVHGPKRLIVLLYS